jgi:hypothetical protein
MLAVATFSPTSAEFCCVAWSICERSVDLGQALALRGCCGRHLATMSATKLIDVRIFGERRACGVDELTASRT